MQITITQLQKALSEEQNRVSQLMKKKNYNLMVEQIDQLEGQLSFQEHSLQLKDQQIQLLSKQKPSQMQAMIKESESLEYIDSFAEYTQNQSPLNLELQSKHIDSSIHDPLPLKASTNANPSNLKFSSQQANFESTVGSPKEVGLKKSNTSVKGLKKDLEKSSKKTIKKDGSKGPKIDLDMDEKDELEKLRFERMTQMVQVNELSD